MTGLESVRSRHLAAAGARADAMVRDARLQAQQVIADATASAAALVAQAEKEGEEAAQLDTSREWTAARRRARGIELTARRNAYEDVKAAVFAAVRADTHYLALLDHVADEIHRRLGPGAEVVPAAQGAEAVSGSRKHRHVEWSLEATVGACLEAMGPEVEALWR